MSIARMDAVDPRKERTAPMTSTGTDAYLRTHVLTAPPEKLQLMLYEGAIRFASKAREKILEKDYEASCDLLMRAQAIVIELLCGLKPETDPSLCNTIAGLYSFVYRRLVEANVHHRVLAVDDAVEVLSIQRDIWLELLEKLAEERADEAQPQHASVNARA